MTVHANTREDILEKVRPGKQLTTDDLAKAAANLLRLRALILDIYPHCIEYEVTVFTALESTRENGNWTNFILDIFIDIAIGIASGAAIASGNPGAVPAIACLSAFLHDWGIGKDRPNNLLDVFTAFADGHEKTQLAAEMQLNFLADPANNYGNLTAAWQDDIKFNGKTYTLGDLASQDFPETGEDYNKMLSTGITYFKQSVWNLVIMKCCKYYENYHLFVDLPKENGKLLEYAQQTFYPQHKGLYLRFQLIGSDDTTRNFELVYWNLGIGGYAFPDEASNILFMDDTPGNIINPDGLFNRSYVFEQFSITKPDFSNWHELGIYPNDFADYDDWNFTGGYFPNLTKK